MNPMNDGYNILLVFVIFTTIVTGLFVLIASGLEYFFGV